MAAQTHIYDGEDIDKFTNEWLRIPNLDVEQILQQRVSERVQIAVTSICRSTTQPGGKDGVLTFWALIDILRVMEKQIRDEQTRRTRALFKSAAVIGVVAATIVILLLLAPAVAAGLGFNNGGVAAVDSIHAALGGVVGAGIAFALFRWLASWLVSRGYTLPITQASTADASGAAEVTSDAHTVERKPSTTWEADFVPNDEVWEAMRRHLNTAASSH